MPDQILKIENLQFTYEDQTEVLKDVSLTANVGEIVGIIGPNGAGKSTLIKLIGGLLKTNSGQILLDNLEINHYSPKQLAKLLGYVPQSVDMPFTFTIRQIVEMGRYPYLQGILHEDVDSVGEVDKALEWMDLNLLSARHFNALSGGEKQRVIIASVLAQQARVLLLDEPTSSLDLKHQQGIFRILKRLAEEDGKTIILVTHDINLAAQFCGRLVLLDHGQILADGPAENVLQFQLIQQVYGVKVYIDVNPFTNSIYIIPYDKNM